MLITLFICLTFGGISFFLGQRVFKKSQKQFVKAIGLLLVLLSILPLSISTYNAYHLEASNVKDIDKALGKDTLYQRKTIVTTNGKAVVHTITIPIKSVHIGITPPVNVGSSFKNRALTAADALIKYDADIAINGSFFRPFKDRHFFDYYPYTNDIVEALLRFSE